MLIVEKNSYLKWIIMDLRCMHSRLQIVNLSFSLLRDTFAFLVNSKCECLLVLDLTDEYNTITLAYSFIPIHGILLNLGSASYG